MLKIGELFAGIGGMGLGVQQVLDAKVTWVSEFDQHASRVLAHRFPDTPNHGDITKIDWTTVEPVDIITGGSPCQDLSHAGMRLGMKTGTRSGLWASMLEAIKTIKPKLVMWENVRGAYSAEATSEMEPCPGCVGHGDGGAILRALGRVLGDLSSIGYDAEWHGIRAADIGACHNRFRVFVTAWPRGTGKPRLEGHALISDSGGVGLEERRLPGRSRPQVTAADRNIPRLPTPAVNDMGAAYDPETWDAWTARMKNKHGNGNGHGHGKSLSIEALRMLPTPSANIAMNGGSQCPDKRRAGGHQPSIKDVVEHKLLPTPAVADVQGGRKSRSGERSSELLLNGIAHHSTWGEYAAAVSRHETAFGLTAPQPTQPTGKDGKHQLSPRFTEWMQGFPPGWNTDPNIWEGMRPSTARNQQLKQHGNSVIPQQLAYVLNHVLTT